MQDGDSLSIICTWISFNLHRLRVARVNLQRTRYTLSMLWSYQSPYHIPSWMDFKHQHHRNVSIFIQGFKASSSPIQWHLVPLKIHQFDSITLSRLIVFLQLHGKKTSHIFPFPSDQFSFPFLNAFSYGSLLLGVLPDQRQLQSGNT